ncbi:MAG: hypothetical protein QOH67_2863 [Hyphomicrobiales bacterium]|jgi:outer membrane lipoprotein SlyB|nr:hypothetical protein [Hyphomicrobiales bacterium]
MMLRTLVAAAIAAAISTSASAQTQRLRGEIQRVEGTTIFAKARDGSAVTVKLDDNATITAAYKATLADVRVGDYIGSGATPQPDGSQKAIEVHIFAASMRGQGDGHRPWNGAPNSTMTNGAVDSTVSSVDGHVLVVKYKDGDKKIVVGPDTPIVRYEVGNPADLKAGAAFSVVAATKQPDGTFTAPRITVGREGGTPQ